MKKVIFILLVVASLHTGASEGEENTRLAKTSFGVGLDSAQTSQSFAPLDKTRSQQTKIAIGTIVKSHHFKKYDYHEYNNSHNGIYLNINRWSAGTFRNSADVQSVFITYNPNLYAARSLEVNLVAGIANGYDGWEYAQGDYIPLLGVSARWTLLKTLLLYDAVAVGIELPLN